MKILIDLGKYKPSDNSIIIYRNDKWEIISKREYLAYQDKVLVEQTRVIQELNAKYEKLEKETKEKINTMAKSIKTLLGE